jgi:hypothetical protein
LGAHDTLIARPIRPIRKCEQRCDPEASLRENVAAMRHVGQYAVNVNEIGAGRPEMALL